MKVAERPQSVSSLSRKSGNASYLYSQRGFVPEPSRDQLHCYLQQARLPRIRDSAEIAAAQRHVGIAEVGVVPHVVGFEPELQLSLLVQFGVLRQDQVPVMTSGTANHTDARRAVAVGGRRSERGIGIGHRAIGSNHAVARIEGIVSRETVGIGRDDEGLDFTRIEVL